MMIFFVCCCLTQLLTFVSEPPSIFRLFVPKCRNENACIHYALKSARTVFSPLFGNSWINYTFSSVQLCNYYKKKYRQNRKYCHSIKLPTIKYEVIGSFLDFLSSPSSQKCKLVALDTKTRGVNRGAQNHPVQFSSVQSFLLFIN